MVIFDDFKQNQKIKELVNKEEEELIKSLAKKHGFPYIDLTTVSVQTNALGKISKEKALQLEAAGFYIKGKEIHIAIKSPASENFNKVKKILTDQGLKPKFYMASEKSLKRAWERYEDISKAEEAKAGSLDLSEDQMKKYFEEVNTVEDINQQVTVILNSKEKRRVSRALEAILAGAIAVDASDIHIEPEEEEVILRFRLDGVLNDILKIDHKTFSLINSRIKLLSGMKLTTTEDAQDGRFSILVGDLDIGIRSSLIPGAYGESIVLRLLNPKSISVGFEDLGIEPKIFEVLQKEIKKPNGMILNTGPTGSGKTTTLYSFLRKIHTPDIKIITIENPVEYHLPGITQTGVNKEKGYTFASGLRSALRQDPDVVMVGEIRDEETASIAVNSSLTGHIVFSTLHTNNAAGTIPRLIDLGVNPKIISSALTVSMAQRLVRLLCPKCKKQRKIKDEELNIIQSVIENIKSNKKDISHYQIPELNSDLNIYEPVGCKDCQNTGYKGRMGIFEVILTDSHIEKIITSNPSEREIKKAALNQGLLDMREDGVIKTILGKTSFEEVAKAVDLEEEFLQLEN